MDRHYINTLLGLLAVVLVLLSYIISFITCTYVWSFGVWIFDIMSHGN